MRSLMFALLTMIMVSSAATVTFQPDAAVGKDTITWKYYPNSNFGTFEAIEWGTLANPDDTIHGFIEFTELNDAQYQGVIVTSAIIHFYAFAVDGAGQPYQYGPCNAPWEENTLTWNTMPGTHETITITYPSSTGWISYDITAWVQNWLDGTWNNNGLAFINNEGTNQYICARSSDYAVDPSLRPKLVLDYNSSALEENTWGEIKALF